MSDRAAISRLLFAYCDAVDANRAEDIVALFTPDAVFDFGYGRIFAGRSELTRMFRGLDHYSATSHHLSNVVVDLVDANTARCASRVYAFHRRADTGEPVHLWGRYRDTVVRGNDNRWLIARRQLRAAAELGTVSEAGRPGRWEPIERRSSADDEASPQAFV